MMENQKTKHLKFFGIGKILPYIKEVRRLMLVMVIFGLLGSVADIVIPQYQRYALDHFIGKRTFDTIVLFVVAYLVTIILQSVVNYISCSLAMIIETSS